MSQNKIHITADNMAEWLSSTGFLFPRNELELARFDKLYPVEIENSKEFKVDCSKIINNTLKTKTISLKPEATEEDIVPLKMVARKGSSIPKHILDKIKLNQDERSKDNFPGKKEGTE
eukprot:TRINITY_DN8186_c0_g1_i1.p4 TRINITY_DN8186_c0_g1~~TRINITY_DN8186_c0_g1_i1.p4  ORF type:complete len:118 (+),score=10.66 TRINITY_DN8186_c0_g1_i1:1498-1851(+)